ncbi:MAG: peptide chain release factor N(5)-glutamine methyltransferase [Alphaproteobacteria bacterium]|nr:peptide chain release factor N(5)-glutamine methyltransferase [Alphaproteobacteria bacterium]
MATATTQRHEGEARSTTIGEAVAWAASRFAACGLPEPRREARLLLALALGCDGAIVLGYPEREVPAAAAARLQELVSRRAAGEPAARLVGHREFWGMAFALSPATLVPRPDSETLIEAALACLPDRRAPLRILDLGTGTGCLLLALLKELPAATGFGIDLSAEAAMMARRNAAANGLASRAGFLVGSWGRAVIGGIDVILANPPYIPSGVIPGLAPEVARHDPMLALDGGADGLSAYRELAPEMARLLTADGLAVLEVGAGQARAVERIAEQAGLALALSRPDLSGTERCLVLHRRH